MTRRSQCSAALLVLAAAAAWLSPGAVDAAPDYAVTGVRVSASDRIAIVNGRILRVGERVDGAEIVSIDGRGVRLRAGAGALTVRVGAVASPRPASPGTAARVAIDAPSTPRAANDAMRYGPVEPGETLSEIAAAAKRGSATLDQFMSAVFRANPDAFRGNVNLLLAGARLTIPDNLREQTPEAATAELTHQHLAWRNTHRRDVAPAGAEAPGRYGPVQPGETLSEIGARLLPAGFTLDQMMLALFDANRGAFGASIHELGAGARLALPARADLDRRTAATAAAEVARQTEAWLAGLHRRAPPALGVSTPIEGRKRLSGMT